MHCTLIVCFKFFNVLCRVVCVEKKTNAQQISKPLQPVKSWQNQAEIGRVCWTYRFELIALLKYILPWLNLYIANIHSKTQYTYTCQFCTVPRASIRTAVVVVDSSSPSTSRTPHLFHDKERKGLVQLPFPVRLASEKEKMIICHYFFSGYNMSWLTTILYLLC